MDTTTPRVQDTVTFRSGGAIIEDRYAAKEGDIMRTLYEESISDTTQRDIKDFLMRQVIIKQGTWSSTDQQGKVLASFLFPKDLMYFQSDNSEITQMTSKMRGFLGFKARVRLQIELTSQPFQQGGLLIHYIPYADYMPQHAAWFAPNGVTNLVAATGCPGAYVNLSTATSLHFETPYVSPYLYFNLATGQGSFGQVYLSVMEVLASQSSTTVPYTIVASFVDVELVYPTDAPLTTAFAQMGEMGAMEKGGVISNAVGSVGKLATALLPAMGMKDLARPVGMFATTAMNIAKMFGMSKPVVEAPVTRVKQAPCHYMLNSDGPDNSHNLALSATYGLADLPYAAGTEVDEMQLAVRAGTPCYSYRTVWSTTDIADTVITYSYVSPSAASTTYTRVPLSYAIQTTMPLCASVASDFAFWRGTMVYKFVFWQTPFHAGKVRITFRPGVWVDSTTVQNMPGYDFTEYLDMKDGSEVTMRIPFASVRPWLSTQYDPILSSVSNDPRNFSTGTIQMAVVNPLVAASTVSNTIGISVFQWLEDAQFAGPIQGAYTPYNCPNINTLSEFRMGKEVPNIKEKNLMSNWSDKFENKAHSTAPRYKEEPGHQPVKAEAQMGTPQIVRSGQRTDEIAKVPRLPLAPFAANYGEVITSYKQLLSTFFRVATIQTGTYNASPTNAGCTGNGFTIFPWAPVAPPGGAIQLNAAGAQTPTYTIKNTIGNNTIISYNDQYSRQYSKYAFFRGSMRYKIRVISPGTNYDRNLPWTVTINTMNMPLNGTWRPNMLGNTASWATNLSPGPVNPTFDIAPITTGTLKTGYTYQPEFCARSQIVYPNFEGAIEFQVPYYSTGYMCPTTYSLYDPYKARSIYYPIPIVSIVGPTTSTGAPVLTGCTFDVFRAVGDDFRFMSGLGSPDNLFWYSSQDPT